MLWFGFAYKHKQLGLEAFALKFSHPNLVNQVLDE